MIFVLSSLYFGCHIKEHKQDNATNFPKLVLVTWQNNPIVAGLLSTMWEILMNLLRRGSLETRMKSNSLYLNVFKVI